MKHRLRWLPNLITMGNLFFGFLAILFGTRVHSNHPDGIDYYFLAMIMMLVAGLFDFFDGYVARMLGVSSAVGRELDSLADVVSFGVAPALLLYQLALTGNHWVGVFASSFYVCCSAWRLARHNVIASGERKPYFTGMPIEGGAVLLMSVVLSTGNKTAETASYFTTGMAFFFILIAGLLMISTLRFTNQVPWSVRLGALILMTAAFVWPTQWIFLIPFSYVAYGLISNIIMYVKRGNASPAAADGNSMTGDAQSSHPAEDCTPVACGTTAGENEGK